MSQSDFATIDTANTSGDGLATILESWRDALHSQHSGSSRPSYVTAGMCWLDTTGSPVSWKYYDGADDIVIGYFDHATNTFQPVGKNPLFTLTDNGATVGPTMTLLRVSASPAASDIIGRVLFQGNDSAANTEDYAEIDTQIDDPTSASEDASVRVRAKVAGTMTTLLTAGAGGLATPLGLLLSEIASGPSTAANQGGLYVKEVGGQSELFYREESSGDEVQLTSNGGVMSSVFAASGSLSGASQNLAIPSWPNCIEIQLRSVSLDATGQVRLRIGDAGGIEDANYTGSLGVVVGGTAAQLADGFYINASAGASTKFDANIRLRRHTTDRTTWIADWNLGFTTSSGVNVAGGSKALSAAITQAELQVVTATAFDDGTYSMILS